MRTQIPLKEGTRRTQKERRKDRKMDGRAGGTTRTKRKSPGVTAYGFDHRPEHWSVSSQGCVSVENQIGFKPSGCQGLDTRVNGRVQCILKVAVNVFRNVCIITTGRHDHFHSYRPKIACVRDRTGQVPISQPNVRVHARSTSCRNKGFVIALVRVTTREEPRTWPRGQRAWQIYLRPAKSTSLSVDAIRSNTRSTRYFRSATEPLHDPGNKRRCACLHISCGRKRMWDGG